MPPPTRYDDCSAGFVRQTINYYCHCEKPHGATWQSASLRSIARLEEPQEYGLPRQCAHWLAMTVVVVAEQDHSALSMKDICFLQRNNQKNPPSSAGFVKISFKKHLQKPMHSGIMSSYDSRV